MGSRGVEEEDEGGRVVDNSGAILQSYQAVVGLEKAVEAL